MKKADNPPKMKTKVLRAKEGMASADFAVLQKERRTVSDKFCGGRPRIKKCYGRKRIELHLIKILRYWKKEWKRTKNMLK
jgi:hypothetical protein